MSLASNATVESPSRAEVYAPVNPAPDPATRSRPPRPMPSPRCPRGDDEHTFGGDRDSLTVGNVARREGLCAVDAIDVRACTHGTQRRSPQIAQAERASVGRAPWLVRGCAEDVVQNQRAHPAVDVTGRALVSGTERDLSPNHTISIAVDHQWR